MSKQGALAKLFARLGLLGIALRCQRPRLPVLAYHRILEDDTRPAADRGLFSATVSDFDKQMAWVARHYDSVNFRQLGEGLPLPDNPIVITFDDGYEDNYRLAFPVLKKHGLTAVFYVATDFIDHGEPLWFDHVATLVAGRSVPASLNVAGVALHTAGLSSAVLIEEILRLLKRVPGDQRDRAIRQLEGQLQGQAVLAPGKPMTWPQLEEMTRSGMEIGSHSTSHTVLANESIAVITREMIDSRARLESMLHVPCVSIAYPVGGPAGIDDRVIKAAADCGYQYGCTYVSGSNRLPLKTPHALRRHHVELETGLPLFQAQLAWPALFGYHEETH